MTGIHVADTGLFVAMGDPDNERYRAVRRFARRNDVVFVLPERVSEELTDPPAGGDPPVDAAIAAGCVWLASEQAGLGLTQQQVGEAAEVSPATLRHRARDLQDLDVPTSTTANG